MSAACSVRRTRLLRVALAAGVGGISLAGFSGPASADAPTLQGWWASTNPGGLPVDPPGPPDVAADGLLVQAGPSGPSAYAALTYDLPDGATPGTLTLRLDPNAAPGGPATLVLCALKDTSFSAAQGGPMSDAPAYDCKRTATATLSGTSFTFRVGGLVSDGALAVAVLPGDATTRAVLAHPGATSLTVRAGSSPLGTTVPVAPPAPAAAGAPATAPDLPGLQAAAAAPGVGGADSAVPVAQVAPAAQQPAVAVGTTPTLANATPVAATRSSGAVRRVLAVLLVAALASAGVAWAFAGSAAPGSDPLA